MNYRWDPTLLLKLYMDKDVRDELYSIYHPFSGLEPLIHTKLNDTRNIITEDYHYLKKHFYLKKTNDDILDKYGIDPYEEEGAKIIKFKDDELLFLTRSFYKHLDKEMYNTFAKVFAKRYTNLRFVKPHKVDLYEAQVIHSHKAKETFIELSNHDSFNSLITTIHEFGHAIAVNMNNGFEKAQLFTEIESILPEMIALDYFEQFEEFKDSVKDYRGYMFNSFIDDTLDLHNRFMVCKVIDIIRKKTGKNVIDGTFYHYMQKKMQLDHKDFDNMFELNVSVQMPYYIGHLAAFELYNLYQKDPEKAMYAYKDLVRSLSNLPTDDLCYAFCYNTAIELADFKILEKKGINLGENIDTFEKKLTKMKR